MREAYWRDVIRRQRVWDLSAAEFCDREGVSTASFYNWRKRLAEEDGSTPLFVPLDFDNVRSDRPHDQPACLEIVLVDGCVVRIPDDMTAETIAQALAALGDNSC